MYGSKVTTPANMPISRGSVVDNTLYNLVKLYPSEAREILNRKGLDTHSRQSLRGGQPKGTFDTTTKSFLEDALRNMKKFGNGRPIHFGEMPSFTKSILFPYAKFDGESTTKSTYLGTFGKKADLVQQAKGNIKLEGEFDHLTVQRESYPGLYNVDYNALVERNVSSSRETASYERKAPLLFETQFMSDFKHYGDYGQMRRKAAKAVPATISLDYAGKTRDKNDFETVSHNSYPGIDVQDHPRPPNYKKEPLTYSKPSEKMSGITVSKNDFKPLSRENYISQLQRNKSFRGNDRMNSIKLEHNTSNSRGNELMETYSTASGTKYHLTKKQAEDLKRELLALRNVC